MTQEPHKSNTVLIIIAIIGVLGTIIGATITVMGNINVEVRRQEAERTKIALVVIATQSGATQLSVASTIDTPTVTPSPTKELEPTYTPDPPTNEPPTKIPLPTYTLEPILVEMVSETHQVSGESTGVKDGTTYGASESSWYNSNVYIQQGDTVNINYLSGEWWIGMVNNTGDEFLPQTPTDAGGYVGREEDRVIAQMQAKNPNYCKELISAPLGSLIGRIGETGGIFFVGNAIQFTARESGILFLRMNYNTRVGYIFDYVGDCPKENGGAVSVGIIVTPP